jgi:hypothetical protein
MQRILLVSEEEEGGGGIQQHQPKAKGSSGSCVCIIRRAAHPTGGVASRHSSTCRENIHLTASLFLHADQATSAKWVRIQRSSFRSVMPSPAHRSTGNPSPRHCALTRQHRRLAVGWPAQKKTSSPLMDRPSR